MSIYNSSLLNALVDCPEQHKIFHVLLLALIDGIVAERGVDEARAYEFVNDLKVFVNANTLINTVVEDID